MIAVKNNINLDHTPNNPLLSNISSHQKESINKNIIKKLPQILIDKLEKASLKKVSQTIFIVSTLFTAQPATPETANVKMCYSQNEDCEKRIIAFIDDTQNAILIQAYIFTSHPIADALIAAHKRGINVEVILDKSQYPHSRPIADALALHSIPVFMDHGKEKGIAHNKIMISDFKRILTGSYNFTNAEKRRNHENAAFIASEKTAHNAADYFYARKAAAIPYPSATDAPKCP